MMMMGLFSGISEDVANFFRDFLWKLIETEIDCVRNLINALVNGVLSFGILDNTWIQDGYKAAITLMFIILPAKIIYEFIFAMVREDDNASDVNKKLGGAIMGVMLAVSLSIVVPLANNLSINVSKALIGQQYSVGSSSNGNSWNDNSGTSLNNSSSASNDTNQKDLAKELVVSTLCAFGGMDRNNTTFSYVTNEDGVGMDIGAERFYDYITNSDGALAGYEGEPSENSGVRSSDNFFSKGIYNRWSFYYRWDVNGNGTDGSDDWDLLGSWDSSSSFPESSKSDGGYGSRSVPSNETQAKQAYEYICDHAGDYIWDFGYIGTMIGLAIFMILLFITTIEVAMRIIMIGFLYVIGPLCCLSLTNYQNPQAFTVWKNTILGIFFVNVTQIFMLQLLMNLAGDISKAGSGNSNVIASIALYFGTFSAIIALPKYVQSMIGGYGQGIMESMQQLKGAVGGAWGMTGGAVLGAGRKVMGRHNDNTGHLTGGLRGAIMGNKHYGGQRVGGLANRTRAMRDGLFGKQEQQKKDAQSGNRSGNEEYNYRAGLNSDTGDNVNSGGEDRSRMNANIGSFSNLGANNANDEKYSRTNVSSGTSANKNSKVNARSGGLLGRDGVANRTYNAGKSFINNPTKTTRKAVNGMANVIGVRGTGPRNWNKGNSENENKK